jgi:L-ascorbate oxidase
LKLSFLFAISYAIQSTQAEDVFMTFSRWVCKEFINGEFPGPTIRAMKGDKVHITVINNLANNEVLSIHWHGISQKGTPWADGSCITNSNFDNGKSHTYVFNRMDSGTFWYHSHSVNPGSSRSDGGYGFLLVGKDEAEKAKLIYNQERTIILTDWYHI